MGRLRSFVPTWGSKDGDGAPSSPAEPEEGGPAVVEGAPVPVAGELASVIAVVLVSDRTVEEIADRSGVGPERCRRAVDELEGRGLVVDSGAGYYQAVQGGCAGPCSTPGHALAGAEVVIEAGALVWWCAACWDSRPPPASSSRPRSTSG